MGSPIVWEAAAGRPPSRWIWSPNFDLFAIAGGGSLLFALLMVPATYAIQPLSGWLLVAFLHLGAVVNFPHYVATYDLIVRERDRAPRNYRWFLGSTPVMVGVVALVLLRPDALLSPLVRLYLTWSAYHYAAQHFGIASMYSAKGGRPLDATEKWILWLSFASIAGFMMIMINISDAYTVPGSTLSIGNMGALFPRSAYWIGVGLAAAGTVLGAVADRRVAQRTGSGLDARARLLWITNFAWFVLPNVWLPGEPSPWGGPYAGVWVPLALPFFHCLQYLGVAANRMRARQAVRPLLALSGAVVVGLLLFQGIGYGLSFALGMPSAESLILMMAALNVHHFWLDGLVWKSPRRAPAPAPVAAIA
jgi:hypothetical protein